MACERKTWKNGDEKALKREELATLEKTEKKKIDKNSNKYVKRVSQRLVSGTRCPACRYQLKKRSESRAVGPVPCRTWVIEILGLWELI